MKRKVKDEVVFCLTKGQAMIIVIGKKDVSDSATQTKEVFDSLMSRVSEELVLNEGTRPWMRLERSDFPHAVLAYPPKRNNNLRLSSTRVSISGPKVFVEHYKDIILKMTVSPKRSKETPDDDDAGGSVDDLAELLGDMDIDVSQNSESMHQPKKQVTPKKSAAVRTPSARQP